MSVKTFFPTFVYHAPLRRDSKAFNRELLEQCYLVRDTDPEGQEWSAERYPHGYTSYGSLTDLHTRYPHFEELGRLIVKKSTAFARHLDMDLQDGCLQISSLWVNIMPTHAAHSWHIHPLSVLSGTYYVSTPKGSSRLKFEDPRIVAMMAAPPKRDKAARHNQQFVEIEPRAGDIALWESWLRHEVPPNRGRQDRVSVSFNLSWV